MCVWGGVPFEKNNGGIPLAGWFIMENPFKMDDLEVPLFQETPIHIHVYIYIHITIGPWRSCPGAASAKRSCGKWDSTLPANFQAKAR